MQTRQQTVTIASVRAHGVRQLLVYCNGKREGDWPCHHQSELPIDRFLAEKRCPIFSAVAAAQSAAGDVLI